MLQWPKECYYVANTLFKTVIQHESPSKHYQVIKGFFGLHFLACDSQNQNLQTETVKKGVWGNNWMTKIGVSYFHQISLIFRPWITFGWSTVFQKRSHLTSLPPQMYFCSKFPNLLENLLILLC